MTTSQLEVYVPLKKFAKLESKSLKDHFIERFEALVLSGEYKPGEKIPPERDLAVQLGISRPVVHDGLVDLAAKGLIQVIPRKGSFINDFRNEGSLALLESIVRYSGGKISDEIRDSMLEMRILFECETARLSARRAGSEAMADLEGILAEERAMDLEDAPRVAEIDFRFHLAVALASGNTIYPLLMNSFRKVYLAILSEFYRHAKNKESLFALHAELVAAMRARDEGDAGRLMREILVAGERELRSMDDK